MQLPFFSGHNGDNTATTVQDTGVVRTTPPTMPHNTTCQSSTTWLGNPRATQGDAYRGVLVRARRVVMSRFSHTCCDDTMSRRSLPPRLLIAESGCASAKNIMDLHSPLRVLRDNWGH